MARQAKSKTRSAGNGGGSAHDVAEARQQWEQTTLKEELKRKPEKQEEFRTLGGEYPVKRLYTPAGGEHADYLRDIGFPGQHPFTRGRYAAGYRNFEWPHDFYTGYGGGDDANERYRQLVDHGATSLTMAMDLPTQLGYDPDHPMAAGEAGRVGVAVGSLRDAEDLLEGIPLDRVGISTVGNCIGPYIVALFQAVGQVKGYDPQRMRVRLQNDPLKEYTGRGTYIFPIRMALELAMDVVEYVTENLPGWVPQYVCSTQVRWGGVGPAEETAFGIANFLTYVDAGLARGLKLEQLVPTMDLHMSTEGDIFEEVAKFRATRRLFAKLIEERYKVADPRIAGLRLSTYTAGHRLTAQQPLNNVVRSTLHVLAAMLGGVEHIWAPAYDEALALPTYESTRVAQLTKQIIQHESGIANTVDPLAGSYFLEDLTSKLEEEARHILDQVDGMGGAIPAIEAGFYDRKMVDGTVRYQRQVDYGERVVIGVNKFKEEEEQPVPIFQVHPETEQRQVQRVARLRRERDGASAKETLARLGDACQRKVEDHRHNIVSAMLEAVQASCTVGEIFEVMRAAFGEHVPSGTF
jgi:methylmalonyl-CoA mutase N-terminal domain/subunit